MEISTARPAIFFGRGMPSADVNFEAITRFDSPFAPTAPRVPVVRQQRLPRPASLPIPKLTPHPQLTADDVEPATGLASHVVTAVLIAAMGFIAFLIAS